MELDSLKKQWKTHYGQREKSMVYNEESLTILFRNKTKSAIKKINRKMFVDAMLMVITILGFIALSFILNLQAKFTLAASMTIIMAGLLLHYWVKYRILNHTDLTGPGLVLALNMIIKKLELYIKIYNWGLPALISALYLLLIANLAYYKTGVYSLDTSFLLKSLFVFPVGFAGYFLTKKLTKVLYQKELDHLKSCHKELTEGLTF